MNDERSNQDFKDFLRDAGFAWLVAAGSYKSRERIRETIGFLFWDLSSQIKRVMNTGNGGYNPKDNSFWINERYFFRVIKGIPRRRHSEVFDSFRAGRPFYTATTAFTKKRSLQSVRDDFRASRIALEALKLSEELLTRAKKLFSTSIPDYPGFLFHGYDKGEFWFKLTNDEELIDLLGDSISTMRAPINQQFPPPVARKELIEGILSPRQVRQRALSRKVQLHTRPRRSQENLDSLLAGKELRARRDRTLHALNSDSTDLFSILVPNPFSRKVLDRESLIHPALEEFLRLERGKELSARGLVRITGAPQSGKSVAAYQLVRTLPKDSLILLIKAHEQPNLKHELQQLQSELERTRLLACVVDNFEEAHQRGQTTCLATLLEFAKAHREVSVVLTHSNSETNYLLRKFPALTQASTVDLSDGSAIFVDQLAAAYLRTAEQAAPPQGLAEIIGDMNLEGVLNVLRWNYALSERVCPKTSKKTLHRHWEAALRRLVLQKRNQEVTLIKILGCCEAFGLKKISLQTVESYFQKELGASASFSQTCDWLRRDGWMEKQKSSDQLSCVGPQFEIMSWYATYQGEFDLPAFMARFLTWIECQRNIKRAEIDLIRSIGPAAVYAIGLREEGMAFARRYLRRVRDPESRIRLKGMLYEK